MTSFEWRVSEAPVPYNDAIELMEARVAAVEAGTAPQLLWLLEHPPVYTMGTSADAAELLDPGTTPVIKTGRGGRYTYHGPGQRIVYAVCDLRLTGRDVKAHVARLERWVIAVLSDFGIAGVTRCGRIGVWVDDHGAEKKIAAIGVRVRRWIAYHGIAINVQPDLKAFDGIVPCGIADYGVTSLAALGVSKSMADVNAALRRHFDILITIPTITIT